MHKLETERLLLRPLTFDDSDRIEELAGEYDVAKSTLNIPHPYPKGSA
ncbi:MAG: GNAT family N-acetyltransferase, partial [Solibacillus sp.]